MNRPHRLSIALCFFGLSATLGADSFEAVQFAPWIAGVTRMGYMVPDEVDRAAGAGVQVAHFNLVWPYYPLRRDGGGLSPPDGDRLRRFVDACHDHGIKAVLGLPPFPSVGLVRAHPDWRVHPDDAGSVLKVEPKEDNLGTRIGCTVGPWGDYFIELLVELVQDYRLDGYSFDGNYHAPLCYCPACKAAFKAETGGAIPPRIDLDDVAYRRYLVWRGGKLEAHYRRMQTRLKAADPGCAVISWTANGGRFGHFLTSPRVMSARMNLLFDMPMQEWWLDETNLGSSVAPAFGAAYLRAIMGGRPSASEPYIMSRGNPYGPDSFPRHERLARSLLALTHGSLPAQLVSWNGSADSTREIFEAIRRREPYLLDATDDPWAALLVSEATRQFYAYGDIRERFLPHVYGAFRACLEEHMPLALLNDWDLTAESLARFRVLVLAGAAAVSDDGVRAIRGFVEAGGGLVATGEASLCDELGRPRRDFGLAELFGVSRLGRPDAAVKRPEVDPNFAIAIDGDYWRKRSGSAELMWTDHALLDDPKLKDLVPMRSVRFKGPLHLVSEPKESAEVAARFRVEGSAERPSPAIVGRKSGRGRVVYMAASIDAALWSYAYPYQRRVFARSLEFAAGGPPPIAVKAPMAVHTSFRVQRTAAGTRRVIHFYNGIDSAAGHGLPGIDVPLREETVPVHGIEVRVQGMPLRTARIEPGGVTCEVSAGGDIATINLPPLELQYLLVVER